jgi:hypothetical protein
MVCSYCGSIEHTLKTCSIDNDLVKLVSSHEEPDFKLLTSKVLRKIAYLSALKLSSSKTHIILQLKRLWLNKKKNRLNKMEELEKELVALRVQDTIEDCPICMNTLGKTDVCVTKCGHKYCSTCFVRCVMNKNSCPMCRAKIIEDEHYKQRAVKNDEYIPFTGTTNTNTNTSDQPLQNYIDYITNEANEVLLDLHPTIDLDLYPTIDLDLYRTIGPTIDPTIDPTIGPTIDPTIDPTIGPTIGPTIDPTIDLTETRILN